MFDDDDGFKKSKRGSEGELDITPMIDVTFLLLIFFMVTSTMQGTPDNDIPPSENGDTEVMAGKKQLVIRAPAVPGDDPELMYEGDTVTLEGLGQRLSEDSAGGEIQVFLMGERGVPNGFVGDVEEILTEYENVVYMVAVQDYK